MLNQLLKEDISRYWSNRAEGYSRVNQEELAGRQKEDWKKLLIGQIKRHSQDKDLHTISVLDVGTGPGFFAIILAEEGFRVTAVDEAEKMIEEAGKNAGNYAAQITFQKMDAQMLTFPNETFDVVVSRNLTWVLEEPEAAYRSWKTVLKKGGLLINFDANWYRHLYNEEKRAQYEQDRRNVAMNGVSDHYIGTDIDAMEQIARQVPLSRIKRPEWDERVLRELGLKQIVTDQEVWKRVWSPVEKMNYASTPMFMVKAVRA